MEIILTNENKDLVLSKNVEETLVRLDKEIKEREEQYNSIKSKLLEHMRENGIKNISSDRVSVSYTAPYSKIKFNEKSFKKDNEELYNNYCELSDVKESIRITVKKEKKKEENILEDIVLDIN